MTIRGTSGDDVLYGSDNIDDIFDSDAGGDDVLVGGGGNDTYWLGQGTDHDTILDTTLLVSATTVEIRVMRYG